MSLIDTWAEWMRSLVSDCFYLWNQQFRIVLSTVMKMLHVRTRTMTLMKYRKKACVTNASLHDPTMAWFFSWKPCHLWETSRQDDICTNLNASSYDRLHLHPRFQRDCHRQCNWTVTRAAANERFVHKTSCNEGSFDPCFLLPRLHYQVFNQPGSQFSHTQTALTNKIMAQKKGWRVKWKLHVRGFEYTQQTGWLYGPALSPSCRSVCTNSPEHTCGSRLRFCNVIVAA